MLRTVSSTIDTSAIFEDLKMKNVIILDINFATKG